LSHALGPISHQHIITFGETVVLRHRSESR
jgi:hypothetical protein